MEALILFSHGSLLCGAGEALEAHAGRLRKRGDYPIVEIGYMNYSVPAFPEAVQRCKEAGATRIVVLPFFLVPGYFVSKSLPEHVDAVRPHYPDLEFTIAAPIGFDERLADALIESARSPLGPDAWRDDLTAAARTPNAPCTPRPTARAFPPPVRPPASPWSNARRWK